MTNIIGKEISTGISVFTACMNRESNLLISLKSWLQFDEIDEIIIVDWSSNSPLTLGHPKVKLIRVDDEDSWHLSRAYNLSFQFTSKNKICKLDSDYILKKNFFDEHVIEPQVFYTGNYRLARNLNEENLNGFCYFFRDDFLKVNGYNENICTPGWEDCDLYERLENLGLKRRFANFDFIEHIEHENPIRGSGKYPIHLIEENQAIARENPWGICNKMIRYNIIKRDRRGHYLCKKP